MTIDTLLIILSSIALLGGLFLLIALLGGLFLFVVLTVRDDYNRQNDL